MFVLGEFNITSTTLISSYEGKHILRNITYVKMYFMISLGHLLIALYLKYLFKSRHAINLQDLILFSLFTSIST